MTDADTYILCALADQAYTVTGSVFDKFCTKCFRRLMLSPSGQQVIAWSPTVKLICQDCILTVDDVIVAGVTAHLVGDTLANEMKGRVRNTRRNRN